MWGVTIMILTTLTAGSAQCSLKATSVQVRLHCHNHRLPSRLYYEPRGRDEQSRLQRPSSLRPVTGPSRGEAGFWGEVTGL